MPLPQYSDLHKLTTFELHHQFLRESRLFLALLCAEIDSSVLKEVKERVKTIMDLLKVRRIIESN